jgi:hypothetical protein
MELSFLVDQRDASPKAETRGMAVFTDSRLESSTVYPAVEWSRFFINRVRILRTNSNNDAVELL